MDQNLTNHQQALLSVWNTYTLYLNDPNPVMDVERLADFATWLKDVTSDNCHCCGQVLTDANKVGLMGQIGHNAEIDTEEDDSGERHYYGIIPTCCGRCNEGSCFCDELRDMADDDQNCLIQTHLAIEGRYTSCGTNCLMAGKTLEEIRKGL